MMPCATNTTGTVNGHRPENVVFLRGGEVRPFTNFQLNSNSNDC